MTLEMLVLSAIVLGALLLFARDAYPPDKVALAVLGTLVAFHLITPIEAIKGFGNPATITVGCMLALSYGIQRTGGLNYAAARIVDWAGGSEVRVLLAIMLAVGVLSAFINNTAAVALFLPLTIAVSRRQKFDVSKLLMPMSFAAIFAGTCTLIGTSTNLLVASEVREQLGWEIGMFEFSLMGIIFFAVGTLYMFAIGRRLIPARRAGESLTEDFHLKQYVTDLVVHDNSPLIGQTVVEAQLGEKYGIQVAEILRGPLRLLTTSTQARLEAGDDLLVSSEDPEDLLRLQQEQGLTLKALQLQDQDLQNEDIVLVEAWISPNSRLVESTLKDVNFRQTYKATTLAIRTHGKTIREKIGNYRLEYGDSLLILAERSQVDVLDRSPDFLVFQEVTQVVHKDKVYWALGIFLAVVLLAAFNVMSVLGAALIGVAAMVITRCFRLHELYSKISWQTIFMLACLIPLGTAMQKTGLADAVAGQVVGALDAWGPVAVLSGVYLLTSVLTSIMSNNATAVLMIPICISIAAGLSVDPKPFVFAVMFAASASFMTPVGYQTNIFIFGPGGYKFSDFLIVGTPLNIIFWILATLLIPWLWPFS